MSTVFVEQGAMMDTSSMTEFLFELLQNLLEKREDSQSCKEWALAINFSFRLLLDCYCYRGNLETRPGPITWVGGRACSSTNKHLLASASGIVFATALKVFSIRGC